MVGITLIPKGEVVPTYGTATPFRVAGSYRELLTIVIAMVNKKEIDQTTHDILLIRGGTRVDWSRIPDEAKSVSTLLDVIRSARWRMQELLEKAWELGGQYVGEEEFEGYDWVKESREVIENFDQILSI